MTPILLGVAFVLAAAVVIVLGVWSQAAFEERFPPISDEEFMARCKPGTDPTVALKVRRMVAEYFGVEYERVHPSTSFVRDLGAD